MATLQKSRCSMCGERDLQRMPHRGGTINDGTIYMGCPNCDYGERCLDPKCDSPACLAATSTTTERGRTYTGTGPGA